MDKYEFKVSLEEIDSLIDAQDFARAAEIADTIEWDRVKNVATLCKASDLYKINGRYDDSIELLHMAREKQPRDKQIVYSLCELELKQGHYINALKHYNEFVQIAPNDPGRYMLQYKLYKAQDVSVTERIQVLHRLKALEYSPRWGYELAAEYEAAGNKKSCVRECDELISTFGQGRFVDKARELRATIIDNNEGLLVETPVQAQEDVRIDTANLRETVAQGIRQMDEANRRAQRYEAVLSQETSGQISMVMPETPRDETQVTGQLNLSNIMSEWERVRAEHEKRRVEQIKQRVLEDTGPMMKRFEQDAKEGVLESMERRIRYEERRSELNLPGDDYYAPEYEDYPEEYDEPGDGLVMENDGATKAWKPRDVRRAEEIAQRYRMESDAYEQSRVYEEAREQSGYEDDGYYEDAPQDDYADAEETESRYEDRYEETERRQQYLEEEPADAQEEAALEDGASGGRDYDSVRASVANALKKGTVGTAAAAAAAAGTVAATAEEAAEDDRYEEEAPQEAEAPARDERYEEEAQPEEEPYEEEPPVKHRKRPEPVREEEEEEAPEEAPAQEEEYEEEPQPEEEPYEEEPPVKRRKRPEPVREEEEETQEERPAEWKKRPRDEEEEEGDSESRHGHLRKLTQEEKKLFRPFLQSKRTRRQIVHTLDLISLASYTGNVIITANDQEEAINLAKAIIKEVRQMDANFSGKVAKSTAEVINRKDLSKALDQIENGALIIEEATELSDESVHELHKELEKENRGLIVILIDGRKAMDRFLEDYEVLRSNFNGRVDIVALSNDELVHIAEKYAKSNGYSIDEYAFLALHTRISQLQTIDHNVTADEIRDLVDEAIGYAEKKSPAHLMDAILRKRYDENDLIILREKDFLHN